MFRSGLRTPRIAPFGLGEGGAGCWETVFSRVSAESGWARASGVRGSAPEGVGFPVPNTPLAVGEKSCPTALWGVRIGRPCVRGSFSGKTTVFYR